MNIIKIYADSLRSFLNDNHSIKLKSGHAHEIVAAFFGYKSKISLLADQKYPLTNLEKSEFIIFNPPISFVDQRIKDLKGLSPNLPSSYTLAKCIYSVMTSNKEFLEKIHQGFDKPAVAIAEERVQQRIGIFRMNTATQWIIDVKTEITEAVTLLNVSFAYSGAERKHSRFSTVNVKFPRIAGNMGYGMPEVMPTFYSGRFRDPDFNPDFGLKYYELVAGERRWRAAVQAAIPLSVIVKNLSDNEAAIVQEEENSYNPLSEYAQGMSYAKQIKDGVLQQVDLIEKLGISKQKLSRLLSYSHIPEDVSIAIRDFRKVSSGTAEKIKQLCNKGEAYTNCIIDLAEKIRLGKIGHEKLTKIVEERIHNKAKKKIKKIYDQNGNFLFTIKQTDHHGITINVKKETIHLLNNRILSHALFSNKMIEVLQNVS